MPVTTVRLSSPPLRNGLCTHFLRNLSALLITSRLIGQSLAALRSEFSFAPEIARKINDLIAIGQQGETDIRKPLRDAGLVLPSPVTERDGPGRLVTPLYNDLPTEDAPVSRPTETGGNIRLLAQHLELRARLTAEEAKLMGEEPLRRILMNWARLWWNVARV